jgi:hypothetical protein
MRLGAINLQKLLRRDKLNKLVILILLMFSFSFMNATQPSPKTHVYFTEYKKPIASVHSLDTTFFVKVTPEQAEDILRIEVEFTIKHFSPKFDVLATAWYSPTGSEADEKMITFKNGKQHLVYSIKTKMIDYL